MDKLVWSILAFAIVAVFTVQSAAAQNEVSLVPMQSSATYGNTVEVALWLNATGFQGGQIDLTYDSSCANVTGWNRNTTNFMIGGWSHYDGRDWITFATMDPQPVSLSGDYMIGALTIHCVSESEKGCETPLAFITPSRIINDRGNRVLATWKDGTFRCLALASISVTPAHASAITPMPSSDGASVTHTKTPSQTPTPSPITTASPPVSSAPTISPKGEKELPGFEAGFTLLGLLAISYLITKGGRKSE
ncbi:MAG: hypothetical protein KAT65_01555 [Methanophagales archaeon]|nr:hypothetical protein [Methanophagales archaeon]